GADPVRDRCRRAGAAPAGGRGVPARLHRLDHLGAPQRRARDRRPRLFRRGDHDVRRPGRRSGRRHRRRLGRLAGELRGRRVPGGAAPFKVGDVISAAGVTGKVEEIGLFATTIDTADNVRTFVGNNKIFGDTIQNFSVNPYRRVDLIAQLHSRVDHRAAIALLKERLAQIPNVLAKPPPDVEILELNEMGPRLAVRPYCAEKNSWQVYFDANRLIREVFGEAGYPDPGEQRVRLVQGEG